MVGYQSGQEYYDSKNMMPVRISKLENHSLQEYQIKLEVVSSENITACKYITAKKNVQASKNIKPL